MLPWLILGAVVPSACVCWTAAWGVRRLGPRVGLVDRPGARKIHEKPMPTSGGLAIWLGLVVPLGLGQCLLWMLLDGPSASPAAGAARSARAAGIPRFRGHRRALARSLAAVAQALAAAGRGHRADDPGAGRRSPRAGLAIPPGGANGRGGDDGRLRVVRPPALGRAGAGLCGERRLDRGPREFVQHARQHGRLVGRRGGDRRGDPGGGRPLDAAARQSPAAAFRGRFPAAVRRFLAGISRAQSAAGPAVHGRCRQLPDRLPAGDGHAHGDLCRRRPAATAQAGTRGPWRRCA